MKFALIATIATVSAKVGATCDPQANPSTCAEGVECCGAATPLVAGKGTAASVCQTKSET